MFGKFDYDKVKFVCDYRKNSILLKCEYVQTCYEFAPKKLLMYAEVRFKLLVVEDWKITHEIEDLNVGNGEKYWHCALPGFNMRYFPFVLTSGKEWYSLVNVKDGTASPFIKGTATNSKA